MAPPPQGARIVAAGAVLFDGAGRALLVRRASPPGAGTWSLPGGRVETGEAPEAAIEREVREETGLTARVVCALGVVGIDREGYRHEIHEFLLERVDPGAIASAGDDAAEVTWAEPEHLESLGVAADARQVLALGRAAASKRGLLPLNSAASRR